MFKQPRKFMRQFKMPLEEGNLYMIINNPKVRILDKRVFATKSEDLIVYLEYEDYSEDMQEGDEFIGRNYR